MVPAPPRTIHENGLYGGLGPHPSHVQVAKPFIFEQSIQQCVETNYGLNEVREVANRLQGVQWIENVRRALKLPVRTFMTAVVYCHRFRLAHADSDYMNVDAAAAALFTACKIEDTLKKSRDILCAAYNLKVSLSEQLTPDDPIFEDPAKRLVGLERLMLESSGFDFRNRDPQDWIIKFTRLGQLDRDTVGKTAYRICLDVYRTYAPLKQTATTLGLACVELSARLHNASVDRLTDIVGDAKTAAEKWGTSRGEVMETLLDVLELYTHNRNATSVGPLHSMDVFIAIRIALNKESSLDDLPRFTEWVELKPAAAVTNGHDVATTNGVGANSESNKTSPVSPANPSTPSVAQRSPAVAAVQSESTATASPTTGPAASRSRQQQDARREGTVRYMLDAARARAEQDTVESYFKEEWEEYEEVIERPAKVAPAPSTTTTRNVGATIDNGNTTAVGVAGRAENNVAAALLDAEETNDRDRTGARAGSSVNGEYKGSDRGPSRDRRNGAGGGGYRSSRSGMTTEGSRRGGAGAAADYRGGGGASRHSSQHHPGQPHHRGNNSNSSHHYRERERDVRDRDRDQDRDRDRDRDNHRDRGSHSRDGRDIRDRQQPPISSAAPPSETGSSGTGAGPGRKRERERDYERDDDTGGGSGGGGRGYGREKDVWDVRDRRDRGERDARDRNGGGGGGRGGHHHHHSHHHQHRDRERDKDVRDGRDGRDNRDHRDRRDYHRR